jgi:hypothetical protein
MLVPEYAAIPCTVIGSVKFTRRRGAVAFAV